jgi:catechol 2,3-dioxygenase-like lactoylglutathione lyase family enzyme
MLFGPGEADLITLELDPDSAGLAGGIEHFGIRLTESKHFAPTLARIVAAGEKERQLGDRGEGQPFAMIADPDGYLIELWHMNNELGEGF